MWIKMIVNYEQVAPTEVLMVGNGITTFIKQKDAISSCCICV